MPIRHRFAPPALQRRLSALVLVVGGAYPKIVRAQPIPTVAVVLETSTTLPQGAPVEVRMAKEKTPSANVIRMDANNANADDLNAAVQLVRQIRSTYGDTIPDDLCFAPKSSTDRPNAAIRNGPGSTAYGYLKVLKAESGLRPSVVGTHDEKVKQIILHVDLMTPEEPKKAPAPSLPKRP